MNAHDKRTLLIESLRQDLFAAQARIAILESILERSDKCCRDLGEFCSSLGYTDELNEWMDGKRRKREMMSNTLARMTSNEDGDIVKKEDQKWCYVEISAGSRVTLCTGEVFDYGEGIATAEIKTVNRGGITCEDCLNIIKLHKSIKL